MSGDHELSKSRRASKSHQWFKSYGHFTEGVDFAYLWTFSGGGSALVFLMTLTATVKMLEKVCVCRLRSRLVFTCFERMKDNLSI